MLKSFFDHLRAKRVSPSSVDGDFVVPQTSSVEEIWSSWRYGTLVPPALKSHTPSKSNAETPPKSESRPDPDATKPAELVNQLKRMGGYEQALQVALGEVRREEERGPSIGARPIVPWYYWEAAAIYRKLKRYDDEIALVRRFARNYDISFRAFSKRDRSTARAHDAWAAKFLERLETARAAAVQAQDKHQAGEGTRSSDN